MMELCPNTSALFIKGLLPTSNINLISKALEKDNYLAGFLVAVIEHFEPIPKDRIRLGIELFGEDWMQTSGKVDNNWMDGYEKGQLCCAYQFDPNYEVGPDCLRWSEALEADISSTQKEGVFRFQARVSLNNKTRLKQHAVAGYWQIYFKSHMTMMVNLIVDFERFNERVLDGLISAS